MEDGQRGTAPARDRRELDERRPDLPLRGEIACVLRRVGVADHHLAAEQLFVDRRRGAERLHRLEQRDDVLGGRQPLHAAHVLRRVDTGDDHRLARRGEEGADALVGLDRVACVHAHLDGREVEAEDLHTPPQRRQRAVGDARAAVRAQAAVDRVEIACEAVVRAVLQAAPDEAQLAAVGLVEVLVADLDRVRGQLALVARDRLEQLPGDGR